MVHFIISRCGMGDMRSSISRDMECIMVSHDVVHTRCGMRDVRDVECVACDMMVHSIISRYGTRDVRHHGLFHISRYGMHHGGVS